MKNKMKKVIFTLIFPVIICCMVVYTIIYAGPVLEEKNCNRYYMLEKELEARDETYPLQIYGSCHAYTSFDPLYVIERYGINAYNMSNPGEIIPTTYLRMLEQFKRDVPKIALVEVWGLNVYETYFSTDLLLNEYFQMNIERFPISAEKIEIIRDFPSLDLLYENVPFFRYRSRLTKMDFKETDFHYSYELLLSLYEHKKPNLYAEMTNRFAHNGFLSNDPVALGTEYTAAQAVVEDDDILPVEADIGKYLDKIIDLCSDYGVKLVFYRSPYVSAENELRKINWLERYLAEKEIPFFDMEALITFDYDQDFQDAEHLSKYGAEKVTAYLCEQIFENESTIS